MPLSVTLTDPRDLSDRQLLLYLVERITAMSAQADAAAAAAETALSAKVDQLLAAFAAGKTQVADLQAQLTALQAQIASGGLSPGDAAELSAAVADMQAKAAAIDAALTTATTPVP